MCIFNIIDIFRDHKKKNDDDDDIDWGSLKPGLFNNSFVLARIYLTQFNSEFQYDQFSYSYHSFIPCFLNDFFT